MKMGKSVKWIPSKCLRGQKTLKEKEQDEEGMREEDTEEEEDLVFGMPGYKIFGHIDYRTSAYSIPLLFTPVEHNLDKI